MTQEIKDTIKKFVGAVQTDDIALTDQLTQEIIDSKLTEKYDEVREKLKEELD